MYLRRKNRNLKEEMTLKKRIPVIFAAVCMALGVILIPQMSATSVSPVAKASPAVGLPDLIVRSDVLRDHWVVRIEDLPADFCSVIEGEVTPGTRKLVRFTVTTPNIGTADIFV